MVQSAAGSCGSRCRVQPMPAGTDSQSRKQPLSLALKRASDQPPNRPTAHRGSESQTRSPARPWIITGPRLPPAPTAPRATPRPPTCRAAARPSGASAIRVRSPAAPQSVHASACGLVPTACTQERPCLVPSAARSASLESAGTWPRAHTTARTSRGLVRRAVHQRAAKQAPCFCAFTQLHGK